MSNQKVDNQAEKHLIVGSLEVVGDISGSGIKAIKLSVDSVANQVAKYASKQEDYWTEIASDGIISSEEKKTLYKEYKNIEQTYTSLINLAKSKLTDAEYDASDRVKDFIASYEALYNELYVTLKLFDNMSESTTIGDRDAFLYYYTAYYDAQLYIQVMLSTGQKGEDGQIRLLTSLDDIGTAGEVALYGNHIYRYVDNVWQELDTQEDYWTELITDTNVTPLEKLTLKREWLAILQEKTAVDTLAQDNNIQSKTQYTNYLAAFNALQTMLVTTYKLFDNMAETTVIESRDTFTQVFNSYYTAYSTVKAYVENYTWYAASEDSLITPTEKRQLKREIAQITKTYTSIITTAQNQGIANTSEITAYMLAYSNLYQEIFSTLKLFDDMETTTEITDRESFDDLFAIYYVRENYTVTALAAGTVGQTEVRQLTSLLDMGTENELGAYQGKLYQFYNGQWRVIGGSGYLSIQESVPDTEIEGSYFLAGNNFVSIDTLITPEGEELLDPTGEIYYSPELYTKGYIYVFESTGWNCVTDKNNYMYFVAITDLVQLGETTPYVTWTDVDDIKSDINSNIDTTKSELEDEIDDAKSELEGKISTAESEIENAKKAKYLGTFTGFPTEDVYEGCWFTYTGTSTTTAQTDTGTLVKAMNYRWLPTDSTKKSYKWYYLDPANSLNLNYYSVSLQDVLNAYAEEETIPTGVFSTIFCQTFFGNAASIQALQAKTIVLTGEDAMIKTSDYVSETSGFCVKADGTADFNGTTHIGGNTTIAGICNVDKLHFNKVYSQDDTGFANGDIWLVGVE